MTSISEFISYGGGVNSTAALLLLKPKVLIFADTGGEHPETYRYIEEHIKPFVASYGGQFTAVRASDFGGKYRRLQDQAFAEHIIPVRVNRWCTDKYKIRPIRAYLKRNGLLPVLQMIAIDAGEAHRARDSRNDQIRNRFPLLEQRNRSGELGLDREDCIEVIRCAGWPVPRKSGCFFCPFQSKPQWIALKRELPDLFQIAVQLERNGSNYGRLYLAADKPLEQWLKSGRIREGDPEQLSLATPCACYDG